jgi:hypothetical protein
MSTHTAVFIWQEIPEFFRILQAGSIPAVGQALGAVPFFFVCRFA